MIKRSARHQLVQHPETLLIVGKRRRLAICLRFNRSRCSLSAALLLHQVQLEQRSFRRRKGRELLGKIQL
ncbi:MAG: hypothetical protein DMF71_09890 [Acidobacteria bacterium]|nr:MAG: hypothetical protein DMF71_09890 [Acidobacteriota bacterium]